MALNPKEANNADVADGVMELLPRYLEKESVVAVGEVGYDDVTPAEEKYFAAQLDAFLARGDAFVLGGRHALDRAAIDQHHLRNNFV